MLKDIVSKERFIREIPEPIEVKTGLMEGNVLSPILFNLILQKNDDWIEEEERDEWNERNTIESWNHTKVDYLVLTDNIEILTKDKEDDRKSIVITQNSRKVMSTDIIWEQGIHVIPTS